MSVELVTSESPRLNEVEVVPLSEMDWVLPKVFYCFIALVALFIGIVATPILILIRFWKKKENPS